MPYTDFADVSARITARTIRDLTDDEKKAMGVDLSGTDSVVRAAILAANADIDPRIDEAIADADTMINTYVRRYHKTPILIDTAVASTPANTPPTIRQAAVQLTIFNLYARRRGEFEIPESVVMKKQDTVAILKAIGKGELEIGDSPPAVKSAAVVSATSTPAQAFTTTTLEDF